MNVCKLEFDVRAGYLLIARMFCVPIIPLLRFSRVLTEQSLPFAQVFRESVISVGCGQDKR